MDTWSLWLPNRGKFTYMGSRQISSHDHSWRKNAKIFNGHKEKAPSPKPLSGHDIVEQY